MANGKIKRIVRDKPKSSCILAWCYGIHGVAIGGFFFLATLIGSQGARSSTQANMFVASAIFLPVPMFLTALAFGLRWRRARLLAVLLPVIISICFLVVIYCQGRSIGESWIFLYDKPALIQFIAYFWDLQCSNLPGAVVLAVLALVLPVRDGKKSTTPVN